MRARSAWIALGLAALSILPYVGVLGHAFLTLGDEDYVTANPYVRDGLSREGLVWAFTRSHAANWHPLTWVSHMLDVELFGTNPAGHHATSVALHAASALLLWLALRALTGATWRPALVAALFAVHPLRVESVAWVAERKDVLAGLFWMLALVVYAGHARRPRRLSYVALVLVMACGLMCKPTLVTLPLVLLLLDVWPLRRWELPGRLRPPRQVILEKLPLLALAAISSVVTLAAQRGAMAPTSLGLARRAAAALVAVAAYVRDTVWPAHLSYFYPHPALENPPRQGFIALGLGAGVAIAALTALTLARLRRQPYLAVGWGWYLVTLVPVLGLVQVGMQARADRYTYLPSIGLYVMLAWSAAALLARRPQAARLARGAAALALVVLGALTARQAAHWRDSRSLFERALAVDPGNWVALDHLGVVLQRAGDLDGARARFEQALALNPRYFGAHYRLGGVLAELGDGAAAAAQFEAALGLEPGNPEGWIGAGIVEERQNRLNRARELFERALALAPDDPRAHQHMGSVLDRLGDLPAAREHYERALAVDPRLAEAHRGLGSILARQGDPAGARAHLELAVAAQPDVAALHSDLGAVLERLGQLRAARAHYERALALDADNAVAHANLGSLLYRSGDAPGAAEHLARAAALVPDEPTTQYNLGVLAKRAGDLETARAHLQRALALDPGYAEAHVSLGSVLEAEGKIDLARAAFERALEVRPDYAEAHYNLGVLLAREGRGSEAADRFRHVLELRPDFEPARAALATLP